MAKILIPLLHVARRLCEGPLALPDPPFRRGRVKLGGGGAEGSPTASKKPKFL